MVLVIFEACISISMLVELRPLRTSGNKPSGRLSSIVDALWHPAHYENGVWLDSDIVPARSLTGFRVDRLEVALTFHINGRTASHTH
jgi:hypothetical protein